MSQPETVCRCDECRRVVASVEVDQETGSVSLVVPSRHDSETHTTRISLDLLRANGCISAPQSLQRGMRD